MLVSFSLSTLLPVWSFLTPVSLAFLLPHYPLFLTFTYAFSIALPLHSPLVPLTFSTHTRCNYTSIGYHDSAVSATSCQHSIHVSWIFRTTLHILYVDVIVFLFPLVLLHSRTCEIIALPYHVIYLIVTTPLSTLIIIVLRAFTPFPTTFWSLHKTGILPILYDFYRSQGISCHTDSVTTVFPYAMHILELYIPTLLQQFTIHLLHLHYPMAHHYGHHYRQPQDKMHRLTQR